MPCLIGIAEAEEYRIYTHYYYGNIIVTIIV